MSTFLERFEEEVNRIGVSRIANTLSLARNTVYNWMAKGNVPLSSLMALGGVMGMDVVYVITGNRVPVSPEESLLLDRYRAASESFREAALAALSAGSKPESKYSVDFSGARIGHVVKAEGDYTHNGDITLKGGGKKKQ